MFVPSIADVFSPSQKEGQASKSPSTPARAYDAGGCLIRGGICGITYAISNVKVRIPHFVQSTANLAALIRTEDVESCDCGVRMREMYFGIYRRAHPQW